jgi:hypothetical protein
METPDLFPAELAAAQLADPNYPAGVSDNDPHFDSDPDGERYDDDHTEEPEPIERSWQEEYAAEVCQRIYNP